MIPPEHRPSRRETKACICCFPMANPVVRLSRHFDTFFFSSGSQQPVACLLACLLGCLLACLPSSSALLAILFFFFFFLPFPPRRRREPLSPLSRSSQTAHTYLLYPTYLPTYMQITYLFCSSSGVRVDTARILRGNWVAGPPS